MPAHADTALIIFACIVAGFSALGVLGVSLLLIVHMRAQRKLGPPP